MPAPPSLILPRKGGGERRSSPAPSTGAGRGGAAKCRPTVALFRLLLLILPALLAAAPARAGGEEDFTQAYQAALQGDLDRAIVLYGKAIAAPDLAPASRALVYLDRGNAYADKGRYDRAVADYGAALDLQPALTDARLARGRVYEETGRYAQAIADYGAVVHLRPDDAEAYDARGRANFAAGRLDEARADFSAAIRLQPGHAELYDRRGLVEYRQGSLDAALADFSAAIRRQPDFAEAYRHRGVVRHAKGDRAGALADYDKAIALRPDDAFAYDNRGRERYLGGQFAAAADDFARFIASGAASAYSLLWLHMAQSRAGRPDKAALAQAATRFDLSQWPGPLVRLYLGETTPAQVRAAARTSDARARIGRACDLAFYLGEAELMRQAPEEARKLLQGAAERCPKNWAEYEGAMAELKRLGG